MAFVPLHESEKLSCFKLCILPYVGLINIASGGIRTSWLIETMMQVDGEI